MVHTILVLELIPRNKIIELTQVSLLYVLTGDLKSPWFCL